MEDIFCSHAKFQDKSLSLISGDFYIKFKELHARFLCVWNIQPICTGPYPYSEIVSCSPSLYTSDKAVHIFHVLILKTGYSLYVLVLTDIIYLGYEECRHCIRATEFPRAENC